MRSDRSCPAAASALAAVLAAIVILGAVPQAGAGRVPDWNDTGDPLLSAVGLHYGRIGGHGLSFRMPVKWWLYVQAAGGLWHTGERKQHNFGLQANYILRQDQTLRLFLAGGFGRFYDKEMTGTVGGVEVWEVDKHWNYGFGVGIEMLRGRRWSVLAEGDFMHNGRNGDIKVVPQVGLYYYW